MVLRWSEPPAQPHFANLSTVPDEPDRTPAGGAGASTIRSTRPLWRDVGREEGGGGGVRTHEGGCPRCRFSRPVPSTARPPRPGFRGYQLRPSALGAATFVASPAGGGGG